MYFWMSWIKHLLEICLGAIEMYVVNTLCIMYPIISVNVLLFVFRLGLVCQVCNYSEEI
jgi:hypothetical protein